MDDLDPDLVNVASYKIPEERMFMGDVELGVTAPGALTDDELVNALVRAVVDTCGPETSVALVNALRKAMGDKAIDTLRVYASREMTSVAYGLQCLLERVAISIEGSAGQGGRE
ncbi:MAG: hypothetical protein R3E83_18485 [Burkholderiaceae bacterium]